MKIGSRCKGENFAFAKPKSYSKYIVVNPARLVDDMAAWPLLSPVQIGVVEYQYARYLIWPSAQAYGVLLIY
jgi:hypothetical protein